MRPWQTRQREFCRKVIVARDFWNKFLLIVSYSSLPFITILYRNKQGQTRYSSYYEWISMDERTALESEIIRKCLSRSELQCSFLEYRGYKVIYRRYASLFFIVGTKPDVGVENDNTENELGLLEFIHTLVETMDKWAGSICEVSPLSACMHCCYLSYAICGCIV